MLIQGNISIMVCNCVTYYWYSSVFNDHTADTRTLRQSTLIPMQVILGDSEASRDYLTFTETPSGLIPIVTAIMV